MNSLIKYSVGPFIIAITVGMIPITSSVAATETYPSKPIEIVVPFAAGGTNDVLARIISEALSPNLDQPVIVLNKPGGSASVGSSLVARAPGDGYTLLIGSQGSISANPYLISDLSYDPMADFIPVALIGTVNNVLVVPTAFPPKTLGNFTKHAFNNPGGLNFSHAGVGTSMSLAAELYKIKSGAKIVSVPYKGSAPATTAVIGEEVQAMFANTISVIPHIHAGKLRPLAVTSSTRDPLLPDVPTFQEAGVDGYEMQSWFGVFSPAGTPPGIVKKLNESIRTALKDPQRKKRLTELGVDPGTFTPKEFTDFVKNDNQNIGKLIREAGIQITR
ncbi:MAG: Bug family tripartite tricarboxylate transporter substrate binding protein [Advenella sp.]|uniref:LacI family transcriptional regulator n=1 Tax=Advenella kashmirensis TaxID=310575 RepID=A0A356LAH3_9BURK|nr:tripartite tricarboxylate transporter substrate binding protein [Advenella sp. FME57]HBP28010.1 LacI family transcriptional regulator [Advenella kashmirensis]